MQRRGGFRSIGMGAWIVVGTIGVTSVSASEAGTVASMALPPALVGAAPVYRQYRDWLLVCDNALRCEVSAMVEDAQHAVRIMREAGPQTPVTLRVEAMGALDADLLRIDDSPTVLQTLPWEAGADDNHYSDLTLTGEAARRAVAELRDARQLDLGDTADDPIVSLMGLTAALLAMDEAQGRLDTPGALVRTGPLRESRVHAPAALPVVPAYPIAAAPAPAMLASAVRKTHSQVLADRCEQPLQGPRDSAHALDADVALVLLECQRTTTQRRFLGFIVPRTQPERALGLVLPAPAGSGAVTDGPLLTSAWFDPDTGTLTVAHKGSGLADCGYFGQWRFDGQGFALATYLEQQTCTGLPYAWPAWYRSLTQPPASASSGASSAARAAMGPAAASAAAASIAW